MESEARKVYFHKTAYLTQSRYTLCESPLDSFKFLISTAVVLDLAAIFKFKWEIWDPESPRELLVYWRESYAEHPTQPRHLFNSHGFFQHAWLEVREIQYVRCQGSLCSSTAINDELLSIYSCIRLCNTQYLLILRERLFSADQSLMASRSSCAKCVSSQERQQT